MHQDNLPSHYLLIGLSLKNSQDS